MLMKHWRKNWWNFLWMQLLSQSEIYWDRMVWPMQWLTNTWIISPKVPPWCLVCQETEILPREDKLAPTWEIKTNMVTIWVTTTDGTRTPPKPAWTTVTTNNKTGDQWWTQRQSAVCKVWTAGTHLTRTHKEEKDLSMSSKDLNKNSQVSKNGSMNWMPKTLKRPELKELPL